MNKYLYEKISGYVPYDEKEKEDKDVILDFIANNEDVLTRNNKIGHMTTSAWITNKDRNKVLMIYHNIYDAWAWVGGHADGDEDLLHVINKEIEEETGLTNIKLLQDDIYGVNIVTVDNHIKRGKIVNSHLHFDVEYLFEASEDENLRIKEDENSGVKWIPIDELETCNTEIKMKHIYRRLAEKLRSLNI